MKSNLLIALGGGFGSTLRFALTLAFAPWNPWSPASILCINVTGSFLIAIIHFATEPGGGRPKLHLSNTMRAALMTGFCGGYTTFSSFCYALYADGVSAKWIDVILNLCFSHSLCWLAAWAGYLLVRQLKTNEPRNVSGSTKAGAQILSEDENA